MNIIVLSCHIMKWMCVHIKFSGNSFYLSFMNIFTTQELFLEHCKIYWGAVQSQRNIIIRQAVFLIGVLLITHPWKWCLMSGKLNPLWWREHFPLRNKSLSKFSFALFQMSDQLQANAQSMQDTVRDGSKSIFIITLCIDI